MRIKQKTIMCIKSSRVKGLGCLAMPAGCTEAALKVAIESLDLPTHFRGCESRVIHHYGCIEVSEFLNSSIPKFAFLLSAASGCRFYCRFWLPLGTAKPLRGMLCRIGQIEELRDTAHRSLFTAHCSLFT
jgi:hypothetical protein